MEHLHNSIKSISLAVGLREDDFLHPESMKPRFELRNHASCIVLSLLETVNGCEIHKPIGLVWFFLHVSFRRLLCRNEITSPKIGQCEIKGVPSWTTGAEPHSGLEGRGRLFAFASIDIHGCKKSRVPGIAGREIHRLLAETDPLIIKTPQECDTSPQHECASDFRIDANYSLDLMLSMLKGLLPIDRDVVLCIPEISHAELD